MIRLFICAIILTSCATQNSKTGNTITTKNNVMQETSIHDFKVEGIDGNTIDFSSFKGKKILIVNTASECGYTPQYKQLEELYKTYQGKLIIVGFPANNFGGQEPGSDEEIKSFCEKNYGVTFPLASKVSVVGDDQAPIFKYLTNRTQNGVMDAEIKWNFTKFLVDENGKLVAKFNTDVSPIDPQITERL